MPDLVHTFQENDLSFLMMVAGAWGIEVEVAEPRAAVAQVAGTLRNPRLVHEMIDLLLPEALEALEALLEHNGIVPWAAFLRRFGELRVMGSGRRDRERPDIHPVSATEVLWYRALIGKAFMDLPPEPQEYAYIPDEFLEILQLYLTKQQLPFGRPASPGECGYQFPVVDRILDHACTLLAALRLGMNPNTLDHSDWGIQSGYLLSLLRTAGLVDSSNLPEPEQARSFLEAPRAQALCKLAQDWINSTEVNDLRSVPGLEFEGDKENHPLETRRKVMGWLSQLPAGDWWNLTSFITSIKEREPDFQRPGGDYDSWFVRSAGDSTYMKGFTSWDAVDGALIRFLICGPLHWLGFLDLASPDPTSPPAAFRFSGWAGALLHNQPPTGLRDEAGNVKVSSKGDILIPPLAPRATRYQVARFCRWDRSGNGDYLYHLTPSSLEHARLQGLKVSHLTGLLHRHSATPLPPTLLQALERWEKFGTQVNLGNTTLLRVATPAIMEALRKTRASRFLGEILSPTVVMVRPGGEEAVTAALAEIGFLTESGLDV